MAPAQGWATKSWSIPVISRLSFQTLANYWAISFPIYEHLFEYIGTQFPPPSSLLYGKMGSITLFFSNGNIKYDTTFYA